MGIKYQIKHFIKRTIAQNKLATRRRLETCYHNCITDAIAKDIKNLKEVRGLNPFYEITIPDVELTFFERIVSFNDSYPQKIKFSDNELYIDGESKTRLLSQKFLRNTFNYVQQKAIDAQYVRTC